MKRLFMIGDVVKVVRVGLGIGSENIGDEITITGIGLYKEMAGYTVSPEIGNCKSKLFGGFVGEDSFELVRRKSWRKRYDDF